MKNENNQRPKIKNLKPLLPQKSSFFKPLLSQKSSLLKTLLPQKSSLIKPLLPQIPGGEQKLLESFGAKANKIKSDQTKIIVLNKTKFNARTDSVNYYNDKIKLKNSKFLNKNIDLIKENLEINKLKQKKPKNLLLTLASKYLNMDTKAKLAKNKKSELSTQIKARSTTSVISSSLNYLDFTSNKYLLNILKNKKAIFLLEGAKIK